MLRVPLVSKGLNSDVNELLHYLSSGAASLLRSMT